MTESLKRDRFFSILPVLWASVASAIVFFFASTAVGWSRGLGLAIPLFLMVALWTYGFPPNVARFTIARNLFCVLGGFAVLFVVADGSAWVKGTVIAFIGFCVSMARFLVLARANFRQLQEIVPLAPELIHDSGDGLLISQVSDIHTTTKYQQRRIETTLFAFLS